MDMQYRIVFDKNFDRDLDRLEEFLSNYQFKKLKDKLNKDILDLEFMPRIHKTLYKHNDKNGEYRRIVSGKYIIIYKIVKNQIIILRIFSHRQDYLNSKKFILRENPSFYNITK